MAGHAQLKFVMTECSKTQIRLTGPIYVDGEVVVLRTYPISKTSYAKVIVPIFKEQVKQILKTKDRKS